MSDDPRVGHGVSGLFAHERGALCVVCGYPAEDTLDAAWRAAEAALPEGWRLTLGPGYNDDYLAGAAASGAQGGIGASGPTPAAALLALTEKLRERSGT